MLQSGNTRGILLCVVTGAIPHQETKKIDSFAILLLNALDSDRKIIKQMEN